MLLEPSHTALLRSEFRGSLAAIVVTVAVAAGARVGSRIRHTATAMPSAAGLVLFGVGGGMVTLSLGPCRVFLGPGRWPGGTGLADASPRACIRGRFMTLACKLASPPRRRNLHSATAQAGWRAVALDAGVHLLPPGGRRPVRLERVPDCPPQPQGMDLGAGRPVRLQRGRKPPARPAGGLPRARGPGVAGRGRGRRPRLRGALVPRQPPPR